MEKYFQFNSESNIICVVINMKIFKSFLIILLCSILFSTTVFAHPGRTDENGGHWDHSTGTYHYHNGGKSYNDTKPSRDYDYDYDFTPPRKYVSVSNPISRLQYGEKWMPYVTCTGDNFYIISSNQDVISVEGKEIVAVGAGSASITIKGTDGAVSTFDIYVPEIELQEIRLPEERSVDCFDSIWVSAVLYPENTTQQKLSYSSDNENIATVGRYGEITTYAPGQCTITVTGENGISNSFLLTVNEVFASSLFPVVPKNKLEANESMEFQLTVAPRNVTNKHIDFYFSDSGVVQIQPVDKEEYCYKLIPIEEGHTTVTASFANDVSCTFDIEVFQIHAEHIELFLEEDCFHLGNFYFLDTGHTYSIQALVTPEDTTFPAVAWEPSRENGFSAYDDCAFISTDSVGYTSVNASTIEGIESTISFLILPYALYKTFFFVILALVLFLAIRLYLHKHPKK